jgi:ribA/ribD-fused uncharacterized protein
MLLFYGHNNPNGYLSNWYPSPLKLSYPNLNPKEYTFQNVEQAMMASKAALFGDYDSFRKILNQSDPKSVKALGRKVNNFNSAIWDKYKKQIVKTAIRAKFTQNPELLKQLLSTGDLYLAEASPYDRVWGTGTRSADRSKWTGQNLLGIILVEVREEFKELNKN